MRIPVPDKGSHLFGKGFRVCILVLVLATSSLSPHAQVPCSAIGQTPPTAFPVCGTTTFVQNTVGLCGSIDIPVPCSIIALYQDRNPYWYKFTCYTAGTLGFLITPFVFSDDYDWHIFDVTGRNPQDVFWDISLLVACNWSGNPGPTGASPAGTNLSECAGNFPTFSAMPVLQAGHQYLMLVSHYTNSQSGYTLTFGGGTASITDPNVPVITSAQPNCDGTQIIVRFSKPLHCSSLTATGSEFSVGSAGTIVSATGHGCASGFTLDSVTLTLSAALPPGNYALTAQPGTDGNTLTDNCSLSIAAGNSVPFTILPQPPIPISGIAPVAQCDPQMITVHFAQPIRCNTVASDGSDFSITGPAAVDVISAIVTCNPNGETQSVTLQFNAPVLAAGNYQVQVATGSDGNTLIGQCNSQVPAGESWPFTILPQPPIPMGTVTAPGCSPSSIELILPEPISCNSIAGDGSDFTVSGPAAITVSGATATCNASGETNSITIHFSSPVTTDGNYLLQVVAGTDGNTLMGACHRQVNAGETTAFAIPFVPPATLTAIAPPGCAPHSIIVHLDAPVQCSSIATDGSDFQLVGSPGPAVISAGGFCFNGFTDSITIRFSSPIYQGGMYQLALVQGSDGNTLLNDCNRASLPITLPFAASDTVSAVFSYTLQSDCDNNIVTFTHPGGNGINSWTWSTGGGNAGDQPVLIQQFPAAGPQTVALTVSNGVCHAQHSETIDLDNKVLVDFELPAFACPDDSVVFINRSSGPVDEWEWTFGNGLSSSLQAPPPQLYPFTGIESFYTISLTASNSLGCRKTVTKTLKIPATCRVLVPGGFTPNNDGLNDYLYPLNGFSVDELDFRVYNRWGQLVFATRDWNRKWDGKYMGQPQPTGVFAWTLQYRDRTSGLREFQKGTTVLIR